MKLATKDIEPFLKTPPRCLGVLVYGPDTGLVSQRAEILAKYVVEDTADPFRVVQLDAEGLKDDPARLADELSALSFGGGKRLVRVRGSAGGGLGAVISAALGVIAPDTAEHSFLLVTADDLPATSALRKLFEGEKHLAALPCYVEDARGLRVVAQGELRARNIQYTNEVVDFICEHCQGDRMVCISEIAKLDLYLGAERKATLEVVEECIGSTTESSLDDICEAVAEGKQKAVERHVRRALQQGTAPVAVLRAVQRHYLRLQRVGGMVAQGMGQEQAIGALRPPVFFKQKPAFTRAAARWARQNRQAKLQSAIGVLYQAELSCKSTGEDAELMCSRALMQVAAMGGGN
jgi:DNA polymerase III subunit delta